MSGFLAANRCAGRYLLTVSEGSSALGLISIIALWEMYFNNGLGALWWQKMLMPMGLVLACVGWVKYRFRQTRALTMPQFFEMRYSRKFRLFSGVMLWVSGVLNYAIFPAITARAIIYFCDFPVVTHNLFGVDLNITMGIVMLFMLSFAILITTMGGQITVIVTDFLQGQLFNVIFIVISIFFVYKVGWNNIFDTLEASSSGKSMVNPFDQKDLSGFTFGYFIMTVFINIYVYGSWRGSQGYAVSATSAHEAKMAGVLGGWRKQIIFLMSVLIPLAAYTLLHDPQFGLIADKVNLTLDGIGSDVVSRQMSVPITIREVLPIGLTGLMMCVFAAAAISTDDTYLHSWGSTFIQDVVLPFRKHRFTPRNHLILLRLAIVGVAVIAWTFSMLFPLKDYILMYFQLTGAIYMGGAGAATIGGLYWKRATTAGAWTGMITGSVLSIMGLLTRNIIWPNIDKIKALAPNFTWLQNLSETCPWNGTELTFFAGFMAALSFVVVSLLTKPKPGFEMDKILKRGKYRVQEDHGFENRKVSFIARALGITEEFSPKDKIIYFASIGLTLFWFLAFLIGTILYLTFGADNATWVRWWKFELFAILILGIFVTIWFFVGGIRDFLDLFRRLKEVKIDEKDDGMVTDDD